MICPRHKAEFGVCGNPRCGACRNTNGCAWCEAESREPDAPHPVETCPCARCAATRNRAAKVDPECDGYWPDCPCRRCAHIRNRLGDKLCEDGCKVCERIEENVNCRCDHVPYKCHHEEPSEPQKDVPTRKTYSGADAEAMAQVGTEMRLWQPARLVQRTCKAMFRTGLCEARSIPGHDSACRGGSTYWVVMETLPGAITETYAGAGQTPSGAFVRAVTNRRRGTRS